MTDQALFVNQEQTPVSDRISSGDKFSTFVRNIISGQYAKVFRDGFGKIGYEWISHPMDTCLLYTSDAADE